MRTRVWLGGWVPLMLVVLPACDAEGVGDPCVPEEEYSEEFSGFALSEASTESRSFQCQSRLCLVNHFQGRVSCPYGQSRDGGGCFVPGTTAPVTASVRPQLIDRRAEQAVYCSCRCAGSDPSARYCECPSGFTCSPIVPDFDVGQAQLPGSYCVKDGTTYTPNAVAGSALCDSALQNCGEQ